MELAFADASWTEGEPKKRVFLLALLVVALFRLRASSRDGVSPLGGGVSPIVSVVGVFWKEKMYFWRRILPKEMCAFDRCSILFHRTRWQRNRQKHPAWYSPSCTICSHRSSSSFRISIAWSGFAYWSGFNFTNRNHSTFQFHKSKPLSFQNKWVPASSKCNRASFTSAICNKPHHKGHQLPLLLSA